MKTTINTKMKIVSAAMLAGAAMYGSAALAQQNAPSTAAAPAANNTAINQRDKSADTVKPTDQPNNSADIKLAAAVRKSIVDDASLSTAAHNVKLVASSGVVTLRGPVKNAGEKSRVASIAANTSGVSNVDNQLEVENQ